MLPLYYFSWFRIDNKHMTEPWLDQALMDSAYRSEPLEKVLELNPLYKPENYHVIFYSFHIIWYGFQGYHCESDILFFNGSSLKITIKVFKMDGFLIFSITCTLPILTDLQQ